MFNTYFVISKHAYMCSYIDMFTFVISNLRDRNTPYALSPSYKHSIFAFSGINFVLLISILKWIDITHKQILIFVFVHRYLFLISIFKRDISIFKLWYLTLSYLAWMLKYRKTRLTNTAVFLPKIDNNKL